MSSTLDTLKGMTKSSLKEKADTLGIETSKLTKAQLIEAILAQLQEDPEEATAELSGEIVGEEIDTQPEAPEQAGKTELVTETIDSQPSHQPPAEEEPEIVGDEWEACELEDAIYSVRLGSIGPLQVKAKSPDQALSRFKKRCGISATLTKPDIRKLKTA